MKQENGLQSYASRFCVEWRRSSSSERSKERIVLRVVGFFCIQMARQVRCLRNSVESRIICMGQINANCSSIK